MGNATFRHEAFLYDDDAEFAATLSTFVRDGLAADEDIWVVLGREKTGILRDALGADAGDVRFADMESVGRNPARIIPAWQDFVEGTTARRLRGIGEPIWAGRSDAEIDECHVHESLLNVAFGTTSGFWLVCPYDATALAPHVVERARTTHPFVRNGSALRNGGSVAERDYGAVFAGALPDPDAPIGGLPISVTTLMDVRAVVASHASDAGMPSERVDDLVLAVSELASNSVSHGGGRGTLYYWQEDGSVIYEVRDAGAIDDPMLGRVRPSASGHGGRGLWLVNQLCDLVRIRSNGDGTTIRVHMRIVD